MRARDWSQTALGPIEQWPQSLTVALSICLGSRYPMQVWWGPEYLHFYNDAYRPILGIGKHPQFLGSPGREVWSEVWDNISPLLDRVRLNGEATYSSDMPLMMTRNGYLEEAYFTFSYSPLRSGDGEIGGVFCACSETTAQVLAERRLRTLGELGGTAYQSHSAVEACAHAAAILRHNRMDVPFAVIYLLDPECRSATLAATVNVVAGDDAAPSQIDLSAPARWPLQDVMTTRAAQSVELLGRRIDVLPASRWAELPRAAMVLPLNGVAQQQLCGFLVAGLNPHRALDAPYRSFLETVAAHLATAVMRAEDFQSEQVRADALAELNQAKSAFFSNVSHEFRTPLTLILNPLEQLLDQAGGTLPADQRMLVSVAHRNSLRLLRLVNTLLDFSRAEAGGDQASFEPQDLARLTAAVADSFEPLFAHAGLRLEVDCIAATEPAFVDAAMWEKLVLNLISNAFKFTFEGGVAVRVRDAGTRFELEVRDTGTGIPSAEVPKLFERFHRVAGARGRSFEGSGIGLALVREVVGLHGGTINVSSELGRGTTFTVTVLKGTAHLPPAQVRKHARAQPLTQMYSRPYLDEARLWVAEDRATEIEASLETPAQIERVAKRLPRVLLAEDNADMRDMVRRVLETGGYVVETVGDGHAALASLRRSMPDILLSDVMMPRLDGIGLLRALRADPKLRELPVILLSARAGDDAQVDALGVGADDYLTKPFSAREMLARVGANLTMARARRTAGEVLRDNERRLNSIVHQATVGIAQTDLQGRFQLVNQRFCDILGRNMEQVIGRTISEFTYPEDREDNDTKIARLLESGESYVVEKRYMRPDGSAVWVNNHVSATRGDDGRLQYMLGVVQDISARKSAEEERQRLHDTLEQRVAERTEQLAQANQQLLEQIEERREVEAALIQAQKLEAVGQLTSGVAHDFNNLLTVISGNLDFLQRDLSNDSKAARRLGFVRSAAERGAKLTAQLLSFSRKQRLVPQAVNLNDVVKGMGDLLRSSIGGTMEIETVLADALKLAHVDPTQLELVIVNLAINARDAMEVGGHIRIETANVHCGRPTRPEHPAPGDYVMVAVADSGNGMTPEVLEKAFEPFFTTKEIGKGSGLGLSQVLGLAQQSGGGVRIETERGRGSRVSVYLPLASIHDEVRSPVVPATPATVHEHAKILLVDDDDDVRTITCSVLEELGYVVTQASRGREALQILEHAADIDLMVADFAMPGMNGREVAREARLLRPGLPIVLVTGYADIGQLKSDLAVNAIVQKPFQMAELASRITMALGAAPKSIDGPAASAAAAPRLAIDERLA